MAQALETAAPDRGAALAQLRPAIFGYALGLARDRADAEDLTQETFARALRHLDSLRDREALLPWLYSIATHLWVDRVRERERRAPRESRLDGEAVALADPGRPAVLAVERDEMSECVKGYVGRLSDSYRAVLLLHDVHGLTCPQIAEMLGDTTGSVKIRLHRARGRLRDALASECTFSYDACGTLVCEPPAGPA